MLSSAFPADTQRKIDPTTGKETQIIVTSYGTKAVLDLLPLLQNELFRVLDPLWFENNHAIAWRQGKDFSFLGIGQEAVGRYTTKGQFRAAGAPRHGVRRRGRPRRRPRGRSPAFRRGSGRTPWDRRYRSGWLGKAPIRGPVPSAGQPSRLIRSSKVSRRTTWRARPSATNTTAGRRTWL